MDSNMENATERIRRRLSQRVPKGTWAAFGRHLGFANPSASIRQYFSRETDLPSEYLDAAAAYVGLTVEELVGVPEPGSRLEEALKTGKTIEHGTTPAVSSDNQGGLWVPTTDRDWLLTSVRLVKDPSHIAELNRLIGSMLGREAGRRETGQKGGP